MTPLPGEEEKAEVVRWFRSLRDALTTCFEAVEDEGPGEGEPGRFARTPWQRPGGGGGVMAILRGRVLEKAGVNVSVVEGELAPALRGQVPGSDTDPRFWAAGISVVVHPRSPHVPAAHMNTRMITTSRSWFGGGADLTPVVAEAGDVRDFHAALAAACARHPCADYPRFKAECDNYFHLAHRGEPRGAGGIFFDDRASGDLAADFAFVRDVGLTFLDVYPRIVRRRMDQPWTEADRQAQLVKRGRYAEFNLLYDRGTRFGLMTGGHPEAVLMSLPPLAAWP
jgi:coproporphyrinogen III oxidase